MTCCRRQGLNKTRTAPLGKLDGRKFDIDKVHVWYEKKHDILRCFAYTGRTEQEEDTSDGYDGFGRFDTYYERIVGSIGRNGKWVDKPTLRWGSLYSI